MENKNLLTLFNNGEYERVVADTEFTKNIDELFLRAISQAFLNKYDEACLTLSSNEDILKSNLAKLIDVHMEICFWANKFFDAQKALDHYEEYPYVSQEVEEKFLFYKKEIEKKVNASFKSSYNEDEILKLLKSDNNDEIQLAYSKLKQFEINPFVDAIKSVLKNEKLAQSTRCLGLILLSEKRFNREVDYFWHNQIIKIVPKEIKSPFEDKKFHNLILRKDEYKDVAFSQTFESILGTYYLYMYPKAVEDDEDDLYRALEIITRKYLGLGQNKMRQSPSVEALILKIEEADSSF